MLFGKQIEKNTIDTIIVAAQKIQLIKNNTTLIEIPMKISVPLLENAGLEDGEFLRQRWANLLVNAATGSTKVKVAYPDILRELDEIDVKFLELLYTLYEEENSFHAIKNQGFRKSYFTARLKLNEINYEEVTDNLLRLNLIKIGDGDADEAKDPSHIAMHHKKGVVLFTFLGLDFVKACK
jgi:hypothetical protein